MLDQRIHLCSSINQFTIMNYPIPTILIPVLMLTLLYGCGPTEEERQQQQEEEQQARLDSLEQVWEAEMEEMRQDSLQQAREDSIAHAEAEAAEQQEEEQRRQAVQFVENGPFTVQVRSWRSEERAEEHADLWKSRGYDGAYVVKYGDESTGDVWFRVRLGNVPSYSMAQRLKQELQTKHSTESWIASTENEN